MRKTMIGLMAAASVSILMVDAASARNFGFGGGGARWGGGGGGFRAIGIGGGFRPAAVGGFRAAAIGAPAFRTAAFAGGARYGYRPYYRYNRGFPLAATAIGLGLGYGLYRSYGYYDDYGYGYPYDGYGYDNAYYYGDGGCYVVQQRVMTAYGWQLRPMQVCN